MEVPVCQHLNTDVPACSEVMVKMDRLGFRLGRADEAEPYCPLEGAFGTKLVYDGGPVTCSSDLAEADMFWVRKDL